jgi:Zn-dependent M28 family amino/carboxypeptidase
MTRRKRFGLASILSVSAYAVFRALASHEVTPADESREPPVSAAVSDSSIASALMSHVRVLAADSMEGRGIGTPGSARARSYLTRQFAASGMSAFGGSYERPFDIRKTHIRPPLGPGRVMYHGMNVVGVIQGQKDSLHYIVLSAHYDHLGVQNGEVYNGADDNASGTAALIVLAGYFREHPLTHSLIIAAFDGEERGRLGAEAFLGAPPVPVDRIALNVNLDMIGRSGRGELFVAGANHYPQLRATLEGVAKAAPVRLRLGHDQVTWRITDDWTTASDHGAFHTRGIPFAYFGVEDHPGYHEPSDDVEALTPIFYGGAVETIRRAIIALDQLSLAR